MAAIVQNIRGRFRQLMLPTNIGTGVRSVRSLANFEHGCCGDRFGNCDFINK